MPSLARSLARRVSIQDDGVAVASRVWINFTGGTVTDDPANNRVNVTQGGGGGPAPHATSHENAGSDEIDVVGLSGELADAQKVAVSKNSGATVGTRSTLNFIEGSNITLTVADDAGGDEVDITVASSAAASGFEAWGGELENPNNSDWAVNALANAEADPNDIGNTVIAFDDTIEEGIGFRYRVPTGVTLAAIEVESRAETAPGAARTARYKLYSRRMQDNTAVAAWSAGFNLTDIAIPTNNFPQYDTQSAIAIASIGVTAGDLHQFQLTRVAPGAGTDLVDDLLLLRFKITFS